MPSDKGEIVIGVDLDGVCAGERARAGQLTECQVTRASAGTLRKRTMTVTSNSGSPRRDAGYVQFTGTPWVSGEIGTG